MKKTIVLSVMTYKGGVGKSSISGNLGYSLMEKGYKVLLIDTDAQYNLSSSYGFDSSSEKNFNNVLINNESILDNISETDYENIDIVASTELLANAEMKLFQMHLREFRVKNAIKPIVEKGEYDFIVIDTSATLGILNTAVLHATDYVIIPVLPTSYSIDGLAMFMDYFNDVREYHEDLTLLGMVLNRIDKRKTLSKEAPAILKEVFGETLLKSVIPESSDIENAQWAKQPLGAFISKSVAKDAFNELAEEVLGHVKKE